MTRQRRVLLIASGAAALLSGCGFALRKAPDFVFSTLYSPLPEASTLGAEIRRSLESGRKVRVIIDAKQINEAQVILDVLANQQERVILSTSSAGQVRELQLRARFRFKLRTPAAVELIPESEILIERELSFNETTVLATEAEERLLFRDMQRDIVQQLIRRLSAVKNLQGG